MLTIRESHHPLLFLKSPFPLPLTSRHLLTHLPRNSQPQCKVSKSMSHISYQPNSYSYNHGIGTIPAHGPLRA